VTALTATRLCCSYGARQVLFDVDVTVRPGEVVGLIGPNGAGKSTLVRALAGLSPATGDIRYSDTPLAALSERQRAARRAYVAQGLDTAFPYRVDEVVAMGLSHQSLWFSAPHAPTRVAAALAEVQFDAAPARRLTELSGGERQQVLVARALIQDAPLLLLDEPTSALDLRHRAAILTALRARARRGAAVLLSIHDLNLAALACDTLILLSAGRVAACGPPAAVLTAERVSEVYRVPVVRGQHPQRSTPTVELDPTPWGL
jgi:iron complex transport system ATP-binding protein